MTRLVSPLPSRRGCSPGMRAPVWKQEERRGEERREERRGERCPLSVVLGLRPARDRLPQIARCARSGGEAPRRLGRYGRAVVAASGGLLCAAISFLPRFSSANPGRRSFLTTVPRPPSPAHRPPVPRPPRREAAIRSPPSRQSAAGASARPRECAQPLRRIAPRCRRRREARDVD
jgi:hypothetical protein